MLKQAADKAHAQGMMYIVDLYLKNGGTKPIDSDALARFALSHGHWQSNPAKMLNLCKREFARAFRNQHHTDPQERNVRTFHAVKTRDDSGEQTVLWADMRTAPVEHMETAFKQRREQIVGDCFQLKHDVDSFNENNSHGASY